jgi:hypothetical protein
VLLRDRNGEVAGWCWGEQVLGLTRGSRVPSRVDSLDRSLRLHSEGDLCAAYASELLCWNCAQPIDELDEASLRPSNLTSQIVSIAGVIAVSSSSREAFALDEQRRLYRWDTFGASTTSPTQPCEVTGIQNMTDVAALDDFVCVLQTDGNVVCAMRAACGRFQFHEVPGLDHVRRLFTGAGDCVAAWMSDGRIVGIGHRCPGRPVELRSDAGISNFPLSVVATTVTNLSDVYVGAGNEICILQSGGSVRCVWGPDDFDQ